MKDIEIQKEILRFYYDHEKDVDGAYMPYSAMSYGTDFDKDVPASHILFNHNRLEANEYLVRSHEETYKITTPGTEYYDRIRKTFKEKLFEFLTSPQVVGGAIVATIGSLLGIVVGYMLALYGKAP